MVGRGGKRYQPAGNTIDAIYIVPEVEVVVAEPTAVSIVGGLGFGVVVVAGMAAAVGDEAAAAVGEEASAVDVVDGSSSVGPDDPDGPGSPSSSSSPAVDVSISYS